ncbi:hypothetical protein F383_32735 [Gossypium arboreum]|uniref:Uncharacterized protein n=1 Tax=Gossypium arboreum TaxID=29729 RepID=A0A0B0PN20_GOSAR|nr:hypothetical protein F383_32735 [Gossypium arboreum]
MFKIIQYHSYCQFIYLPLLIGLRL